MPKNRSTSHMAKISTVLLQRPAPSGYSQLAEKENDKGGRDAFAGEGGVRGG